MPYPRPPLPTIIGNTAQDVQTRLEGADALLPVSFLGILPIVIAGALHGEYGFIAYLAKQLMPDSAEKAYLERWASIWGVQRKRAQAAQFQITIPGAPGADIPAATILNRSDQAQFLTNADVSIAAGTTSVVAIVTAALAGSAGNTPVGSVLNFGTGIANVQTAATVGAQVVAGTDDEKDASLLARLLFRIQNPPQGGAATDYVIWAEEQPGVTRAWVYTDWLGAGTVGVTFVMDDRANIFPLAADVAAVQLALNILRPVTAKLTVFAPTQVPINPTIRLIGADTPAIRAAIAAELADFVAQTALPGAMAGAPAQGTIVITQLEEAIGSATGIVDYALVSPIANMVMAPGQMATLGAVTFV